MATVKNIGDVVADIPGVGAVEPGEKIEVDDDLAAGLSVVTWEAVKSTGTRAKAEAEEVDAEAEQVIDEE